MQATKEAEEEVLGDTEGDTSDEETRNTRMHQTVGRSGTLRRSETMETATVAGTVAGTITPGGAEIVLREEFEQNDMQGGKFEALPTAGPGGMKAFLRMASIASGRKEMTRISSSRLKLPSLHQSRSNSFSQDSADSSLGSGHPAETGRIIPEKPAEDASTTASRPSKPSMVEI
jgi:hypothetical protein